MKKNKKIDIKKIYLKFKEAWKNPRKKAGIKLLSYMIFFILLFLISAIVNNIKTFSNNNKEITTTTTKAVDKYRDKQKDLMNNKHSINYVINISGVEYKINGNVKNNVIEGYLEETNSIKKIVFKENNLYEITNDEEIILESDINNDLLNLSYIINLIEKNSAIIEDNEIEKKYTYNIHNYNIIVTTDEKSINQIVISNENDNYILNFDI